MPQPSICEIRNWHFWIVIGDIVGQTDEQTDNPYDDDKRHGPNGKLLMCADCRERMTLDTLDD